MLSEPLAFAYSGWVMGTILIVAYGALACYTYAERPSRFEIRSHLMIL